MIIPSSGEKTSYATDYTNAMSPKSTNDSGNLSTNFNARTKKTATKKKHYISPSLYVGDLHLNTTESELFELFQSIGPVQSIRVCRDIVSRCSLGYAYINFHHVEDAKTAIRELNYFANALTHGCPLRIMWKTRDPSVRNSGVGNIFIKSLKKTIDSKMLYDTFTQFGDILSCKVATNDKGESLGYGFVHFENANSANEAIAKVHGMLLDGRKVYVGKFRRKEEREAAGEGQKQFTNVYIKNVDPEKLSDAGLRKMFARFGIITSTHVAYKYDGKPKGFGFVNFATHEMAKQCVDEMNAQEIDGKIIFVSRAQKRCERQRELRLRHDRFDRQRGRKYDGTSLFVRNLSRDVNEDVLWQEFGTYGAVVSCKVMRTAKVSRGFAFVRFSLPEEASNAMANLNGCVVDGKPLYVALAHRCESRRSPMTTLYHRAEPGKIIYPALAYPYPLPAAYMSNSP